MTTATRTLMDVVRLSATYLGEHGSESARLDAELLSAHALGVRRLDLYLQFDRQLGEQELERMRELVRRRGRGEPVAYITGERDFFGRSFAVTADVLVPRPETETLVECALRHIRARQHPAGGGHDLCVADLGTGSGCIAVTLAAEIPDLSVVAVDVDAAALAVAAVNAERLGVADRVSCVQGSWADGLTGPIDIAVSNPPYVTTAELAGAQPDVRDFEPAPALHGGEDGLDAYRSLIASLRRRMRSGGRVLLEVDPRRANEVAALTAAAFDGAATSVALDMGGRARVVDASIP